MNDDFQTICDAIFFLDFLSFQTHLILSHMMKKDYLNNKTLGPIVMCKPRKPF